MSRSSPKVLAMLVLGSTLACGKEAPPPAPAPAATSKPPPAFVPIAVQGPPERLHQRLMDAYRLGPDRRVLAAIHSIRRVVTGSACAEEPVAEVAGADWALRDCGEEVGRLGADADLPVVFELLGALAKRLGVVQLAGGGQQAAAGLLTAEESLILLDRVEARWQKGIHSAADVHLAATALVNLVFAATDDMEVADVLGGQALAATAIDHALGGDSSTNEALLAAALGYGRFAREAAQRLAPGDPVRAYLEHDDAALEKLAVGRHPSLAVRFLWLRRLLERGELDREIVYRRRHLRAVNSLSLRLTRATHTGFDSEGEVAVTLPLATILTAENRLGHYRPLRFTNSKSLARFAKAIDGLGAPDRLFLTRDAEQAFFRASFFTGTHLAVTHQLETRASAEGGQSVAAWLGTGPDVGPEKALERWLDLRVRLAKGQGDIQNLLAVLASLDGLGAMPLLDLYQDLTKQVDHGDPALVAGLRRLVKHMDSRPRHRNWLVYFAHNRLGDLPLTEATLPAAAKLSGDSWAEVFLAKLEGDLPVLRAKAADMTLSHSQRLYAIRCLAAEGTADEEVERLFRALLTRERDDWGARSTLITFLEKRKRYAEAETVVRDWIAARHPPEGLRPAAAATALARMLYHQGRYDEGLRVAQPAARSWQRNAMRQYGLLLAALGRNDEARQVATAMLERYPSAAGLAGYSQVLWRAGDLDGAAKALARPQRPLRIVDWSVEIAPVFLEVFDQQPERLMPVFRSLLGAGIDHFSLREIANEAYVQKKVEIAFEMASQLRSQGIGDLDLKVSAYKYLKALRGQDAALAWLRQKVPGQLLEPLSMIACGKGAHELMWSLVPDPAGTGNNADFVWLMRAASALQHPPLPQQMEKLRQHFSQNGQGFYHLIGRHLLDLGGTEELLTLATPGKRACEASYYLGLKAQQRGEYAIASDWYRASIENGTPKDGEYRWASEQLAIWRNAERSLKRLAVEKR